MQEQQNRDEPDGHHPQPGLPSYQYSHMPSSTGEGHTRASGTGIGSITTALEPTDGGALGGNQQQQQGSLPPSSHGIRDTNNLFPTPPLYHLPVSPFQHQLDYSSHPIHHDQRLTSAYYTGTLPPSHYSSQQAQYDTPVQQMQTYSPISSPPARQLKSPRQQFSDSLLRGVQNFAFVPAGMGNGNTHRKEEGGTESVQVRRGTAPSGVVSSPAAEPTSSSVGGGLPLRPDSAIRAAQAGQRAASSAEGGSPALMSWSRGAAMSNSSSGALAGPPHPAPTVPLSSRFPPLPPRPVVGGGDVSKEEIMRQYEAREEALMLRVEALGFEPEAAWQVMKEAAKEESREGGDEKEEARNDDSEKRERPAPVLGIRLLQRLTLLEKENAELGRVFARQMEEKGNDEMQDAHRLIQALDTALVDTSRRVEAAEARVASTERALAVACAQNSIAITTTTSSSSTSAPDSSRRANTTASPPMSSSSSPWKASVGKTRKG